MPSRRQSDADKKVMEQPTAEKVMEEKKFSLDEIRKSCMKLFHVTSSTFAGATADLQMVSIPSRKYMNTLKHG